MGASMLCTLKLQATFVNYIKDITNISQVLH